LGESARRRKNLSTVSAAGDEYDKKQETPAVSEIADRTASIYRVESCTVI